MQHLNVAIKYIEHSERAERRLEEVIEKYMHPKYPAKDIFPELWSAEAANWGVLS
jgi:hypothetical protein